MDEVFYDPEFQQQTQQMLARTPQVGGSKGTVGSSAGMPAIMQNGGASNTNGDMPGMNEENNQFAQETAGQGQAAYGR
jgi:hypothetical protein